MNLSDFKTFACPIHGGEMVIVEVDERKGYFLHPIFRTQITVTYRGSLCQCQFAACGAKHEFIPEIRTTLAGSTCSR